VGVVIDGVPANLTLGEHDIQAVFAAFFG